MGIILAKLIHITKYHRKVLSRSATRFADQFYLLASSILKNITQYLLFFDYLATSTTSTIVYSRPVVTTTSREVGIIPEIDRVYI